MQVVFLDRDGVINRNRPDHVKCIDEFDLLPGASEAICRLNADGRRVIVISNQACVGRGLVSPEMLGKIDDFMRSSISLAGGEISASYYCPHRPDEGCGCRKPAPGLILQACRDLTVDPKDAIFIGDAVGDVQAGKAAGCKTVIVLTGRTSAAEATVMDPSPDFIAADLASAVDWILSGGIK